MTEPRGQTEFWSGPQGATWVAHAPALDVLFAALDDALLAAAAPRAGEAVLDIGCGTGATAAAFHRAVAPGGRVTGIDVAPPLLAAAAGRAGGGLSFARHDLEDAPPPGAPHDLAVSRFGVMFFEDRLRAFGNLLAGLAPGGRIAFAAWGPLGDNPWFAVPRAAAAQVLGAGPPGPPGHQGPMAFADPAPVLTQLAEAGFDAPACTALDLTLTHPGGLQAVLRAATALGPARALLREHDAEDTEGAAVHEAVAAALAPLAGAGGFRCPARINLFTGRRP